MGKLHPQQLPRDTLHLHGPLKPSAAHALLTQMRAFPHPGSPAPFHCCLDLATLAGSSLLALVPSTSPQVVVAALRGAARAGGTSYSDFAPPLWQHLCYGCSALDMRVGFRCMPQTRASRATSCTPFLTSHCHTPALPSGTRHQCRHPPLPLPSCLFLLPRMHLIHMTQGPTIVPTPETASHAVHQCRCSRMTGVCIIPKLAPPPPPPPPPLAPPKHPHKLGAPARVAVTSVITSTCRHSAVSRAEQPQLLQGTGAGSAPVAAAVQLIAARHV
jgi:hypothetical protein